MGGLAAEHLLERGFRRFGSYGVQGVWYSHLRKCGFIQRIEQAGRGCSVLETTSSIGRQRWSDLQESLGNWLQTLHKPIGILAVHDGRAMMVTETCQRLGLRVPDDIAVIGVNNDETVCELTRPTISSVDRNDERIGYQSAALLDQWKDQG